MRRFPLAIAAVLLAGACRGTKDPVIARVGKLTITQSEFQRKLADVSQNYQDYVLTPSGRRQFLDVLIREKLVLAAAQQSDVPRSADYRMKIEALRRTEEERVRDGSEALLTTMWLENLRQNGFLKVTDQEARDYIEKHPTEVLVREILVATPEKAQALAKKLRAGASFAKLAKENSLDAATAADGGRFPPLMYGEVIPELQEIVFHMRVGEIGGPLKSKFGYHVLRKDGERRLSAKDPETIARVKRLIEKQKLDAYLQKFEETHPVEVVDDQFK
jgi:peptidyl-prolyl cis-trans isomerase C